jgi:hypothetical protein
VASATVWVERPSAATGGSLLEYNPYLGPAQNQALAMAELMNTRSFPTRVLERLRATSTSGAESISVFTLTTNTAFIPRGTHTLQVVHSARSPGIAVEALNATLAEYSDLYVSQVRERSADAKEFYEEQLEYARMVLESASAEVKSYLATHTGVVSLITRELTPAGAQDQVLVRLLSAEETAQKNYEQVLAALADSEIQAAASERGTANFSILDEPLLPVAPQPHGRRALMLMPMLGLVLGGFASAGLLFLAWRLDRRVWLPSDIAILGLQVPVATLPRLRPPRGRRWPGSFVLLAAAMRSGLGGPS